MQDEQLPPQEIIPSFNSFKLDNDEYDAISFYKRSDGGYNFMILKLTEEQTDYELTDMGNKFIMMLSENGKTDVVEAILGDPVKIIRNYVKAKCEGMIIKKCKGGIDLVNRMMKYTEIVRLTGTLEAYVQAKKAQLV